MSKSIPKHCRIASYINENDKDLYDVINSLCLTTSLSSVKGVTFLMPTGGFRKEILAKSYKGDSDDAIKLIKGCTIHSYVPTLSAFKQETLYNDNNQEIKVQSSTASEVKLATGSVITKSTYQPVYADTKLAVYMINGPSADTSETKIRTVGRKTGGFHGSRIDINQSLNLMIAKSKPIFYTKKHNNCITDVTFWFADYLEKNNTEAYKSYAIFTVPNSLGILTAAKYFLDEFAKFTETSSSDYSHDSKHYKTTLEKMYSTIGSSMDKFYEVRRGIQEYICKKYVNFNDLPKAIEFVYYQLVTFNRLVLPDPTSLTSTAKIEDVKLLDEKIDNAFLENALPADLFKRINKYKSTQLHADHEFKAIFIKKLLDEVKHSTLSKEEVNFIFNTYNNTYRCNSVPLLSKEFFTNQVQPRTELNTLKHILLSSSFLGFGASRETLMKYQDKTYDINHDPRKILFNTDLMLHEELLESTTDTVL
jgi:hypothetical protein